MVWIRIKSKDDGYKEYVYVNNGGDNEAKNNRNLDICNHNNNDNNNICSVSNKNSNICSKNNISRNYYEKLARKGNNDNNDTNI